jgi:hypothetical protein
MTFRNFLLHVQLPPRLFRRTGPVCALVALVLAEAVGVHGAPATGESGATAQGGSGTAVADVNSTQTEGEGRAAPPVLAGDANALWQIGVVAQTNCRGEILPCT